MTNIKVALWWLLLGCLRWIYEMVWFPTTSSLSWYSFHGCQPNQALFWSRRPKRCTKITCLEAKDDTPSIGRNNEVCVHKLGTWENQVTVSKAPPGKWGEHLVGPWKCSGHYLPILLKTWMKGQPTWAEFWTESNDTKMGLSILSFTPTIVCTFFFISRLASSLKWAYHLRLFCWSSELRKMPYFFVQVFILFKL